MLERLFVPILGWFAFIYVLVFWRRSEPVAPSTWAVIGVTIMLGLMVALDSNERADEARRKRFAPLFRFTSWIWRKLWSRSQ